MCTGMAVENAEWMFLEGKGTKGMKSACIVPLYKGKGDCLECANYKGIILLSMVEHVLRGSQS